ncbi:uncharacterized protein MELLADRAFT_117108 [Melampsora larici-populina 98AG31]|uniref:Uncharacterized protein n=1 Tax=Melampsora larici-populina (strain 98AG31 / pathotype 3-4-7) TaxID=747676 RepID=F4RTD5_MELLP|nr:uncharacterized protein MELLADRAFT_117108 [Melampsora larici-populina 98AG31]EGG04241.1 hypothetical protein MELLADRAFT_117108 [Melampsora larici-populina 98AG31]
MSLPQPRKRRKVLPDYDSESIDSPEPSTSINSTALASSSRPDSLQVDDQKALKSDQQIISRNSSGPDPSAMSAVDTDKKTPDISRLLQVVESLQETVKVLQGSYQLNAPHSEFATQKMLGQVQEYAIKEFKSLHAHVDERLVQLESCDPRSMRDSIQALAFQFKQAFESSQDKFEIKLKELGQGLEKKIVSESRAVQNQVTKTLSDDVQRWEKQLTSRLGLIQDRVTKLEGPDLISHVAKRLKDHFDNRLGLIQGRVAKLEESDLKSDQVRRLEKHWDSSMGLIQDRLAKLEGSHLKEQMAQMRNEFGGKIAQLVAETSLCHAKLANSYTAYTDLKALHHSLESKVVKIKTEQPEPLQGSSQIPTSGNAKRSLTPSHSTQSTRLQSAAPKSRSHSTMLNDDEEPAIPAGVLDYDAPPLKRRGSSKLASERGDRHSSCKQDSNLDDVEHFRPLIEEEIANIMTASYEEDLKVSIQSDLMNYLESEISVLNRPADLIREELKGYVEKRLQEFQTSFSLQSAQPKDHTAMAGQIPSLPSPSPSREQQNQPKSTLNNDLDLKQRLSFLTHRTSSIPVESPHTSSSRPEQHSLRNLSNPPDTSQLLSIPMATKLFAPLDRLITLEEDLTFLTSPESQRKATFVALGLCTADTDPSNTDISIEKMLFNLLVHGLRNHKDEDYVKGFTSETGVIMREVFNPIFKPMLDAIDKVVLGHISEGQSQSK